MTIREISPEYWDAISGGNANSNNEGPFSGRRSRQSTIQRGAAVDIYKDVSTQCLMDIGSGIIGGLKSGPAAVLSGMIANSYNSCVRDPGSRNSNGGGSISPGQCTW
ncbi:hypothetical protein [Erwinia phyllosphaerae]|uniref:hypothetical protein n=1 Tax=Erwinia phyllosphaerae TaxID=2853256 RepID=UPI001FED39C1|nr:hypothetical protein [Erwinia phyllosphaerae]MBV4365525.1 hypothetical protein [Erwinia phyllosphaerae]